MKKVKEEDGSVNSLGAIPTGRLVKKKKSVKKLINPLLKETNMSLAKKYLGILFEDQDQAAIEPAIEPAADMADAEAPDMSVACAELEDLVKEMEDGEAKEKLMAAVMKLKGFCVPVVVAEPEAEDDMDDEGDEGCEK